MSPQLIEAVSTDPFATPEFQDRRRSEPRILCDREISIIPCAAAAANLAPADATNGGAAAAAADATDAPTPRPIKARLTDCSLHGLGVMLPERVDAGQQVLVKVEMNRLPMMLLYTVRYCVPMKANEFRAGLRFSGYVASKFRGEMRTVLGVMTGT
jgi:hypothetical protein